MLTPTPQQLIDFTRALRRQAREDIDMARERCPAFQAVIQRFADG